MRNFLIAIVLSVTCMSCTLFKKKDDHKPAPEGSSTGHTEPPLDPGYNPNQPAPQEPEKPAEPSDSNTDKPAEPNVLPAPPLPPPATDPHLAPKGFEKMTFIVTKNPDKFAMFVVDPNGRYKRQFFIMPELQERKDRVLTIVDGKKKYFVGNTVGCGAGNARTVFCNDIRDDCQANFNAKFGQLTEFVLTMDDGQVYSWPAVDNIQ